MHRRTPLVATNLALATIYAFFAAAHAQQLWLEPRLSVILLVAMESALVVFFLIRRDPDETWHSWNAWLTTSIGTLFPFFLRPVAGLDDVILGQVVQTVGAGFQMAAVLSLNVSMGLLPAHRAVKSSGLYRLVRHPLYLAHTIALTGYVISNPSSANVLVLLIGTAFQVLRINNEERLLGAYPDYVAFSGQTRWRLVPYVW